MNISRYNISFSGENDTVTFTQIMWYSFVPEMSVGPEDDVITAVNLPLMVRKLIIYNILRLISFANYTMSFSYSSGLQKWTIRLMLPLFMFYIGAL